jgi:molybdopterin-guanine dinucleotide biosynthesis protein MobB
MSALIPVLSIIGKSGSGKTTLIEKLIPELKAQGLRVATIKHHAHPGFDIDKPGKDTWRHAQAGSDIVIIAAPDKIATIEKLEQERSLDEILSQIQGVDIIITEGYKRAGKPSLEIVRLEQGISIISSSDQLRAIATDTTVELTVPQFDLNDAPGIAQWITQVFLKETQ